MSDVTFTWGNLPADWCWTGGQPFIDSLKELLTGTVPGGSSLYVSSDIPPVENNSDIWVRLNPDLTLEGMYKYQGKWHRPHPIDPSSDEIMIWKGTEANLWSYQGGSGEDPNSIVPTEMGGAMWEVDTSFDFKTILGCGHDDVATNTGNVYAPAATPTTKNIGDTGGVEKLALSDDEANLGGLVDHTHTIGRMKTENTAEADNGCFLTGIPTSVTTGAGRVIRGVGNGNALNEDISESIGEFLVSGTPEIDSSTAVAHENMMPYKVVCIAKRTARKFITVD